MSILFCTPMYGGMCTWGYFKSCLALREELMLAGVPHTWYTQANESLIPRARCVAAREFLKTDFDRMMFIDADIEFPIDAVSKLWNLDVDVAVAAYSMKRLDQPLCAWKNGKLVTIDAFDKPGPVTYAGTGFMMIKREVFHSLRSAFPQFEYEEWDGGRDLKSGEKTWAFFQDPIEDGVHLSEDYFFCKRCNEIGIGITLEPSIRLKHWGSYPFEGISNEHKRSHV